MDPGPADDVVYLALTVGLAAALTLTLRLRDRLASPSPGPAAAGQPAGGAAPAPGARGARRPPADLVAQGDRRRPAGLAGDRQAPHGQHLRRAGPPAAGVRGPPAGPS